MSFMSEVCTVCKTDINTAFVTPRPAPVNIGPNQHVPGPCFVADEIVFTDDSRLIFDVNFQYEEYAVVCRKLTISGGNKPGNLTPCNPGDPGTRYNTNVITWDGRLKGKPAAADVNPPSAPNSGADDGLPGQDGIAGNPGLDGDDLTTLKSDKRKPIKLVIVALEVEVINSGNLVIDWAGQNGGDGGKGQNGGKGHKGTKGSDGKDESWPSSGCDTGTGTGGEGGPGGAGGAGGVGGTGGDSGVLVIVSLPDLIAPTGIFNDPAKITLVTKSDGGQGGFGGHGGDGGQGGNPGKPTSECGPGQPGIKGTSFISVQGDRGAGGAPGTATPPKFESITGACSSQLPAPLVFDAGNPVPLVIRRCFSGSANGTLTLTGQYLDQVDSVSSNVAGITAAIKPALSDDSQITLDITADATVASGLYDLVFKYVFPGTFGPSQTLAAAVQVNVCTATGLSQTTGAQGSTINNFTVTGTAFDVGAVLHDIVVSGLGVNAVNVQVVDEQTMKCQLVIDGTAPKNARSVTIKAGTCQYTLPNAFTVT